MSARLSLAMIVKNEAATFTYDARGRVLTVTAPNGGVTLYTHAAGYWLTLTDPANNTTTYTYDSINEQINTTNPMGYLSTNTHNAAGELTRTTDADGRTIDYSYDAIGEKTGETWVGGNYTAKYVYNAAGELTNASDSNSEYSYSYDAVGRLTGVSNAGTPGVPSVTLTYSYDSFGNMTGLTDSLGGTIAYSYDKAKNLTGLSLSLNGVQTAAVTMAYDANNNLTGLTRTAPSVSGDTIATTLSYDDAGLLTNITHTDATTLVTLASYTYSYNSASQLTGYQDNNNSSLSYGYDANGELTSASGTLNGSNYSVSYTYDANGNRTMTGYTTGKGNELTSDGTYNYTYDNNGNTLTQTNIATGSVTYYTWDYRNRLTEEKVEDSHGNVLNDEKFTYDVNNNRIATSLNGTTQLYMVYDGSNAYMDFNGSGTLTERYLANPNSLSLFYGQVNANGTTQWFLTDNINSIRQVVGTSGSVLDAIIYDPYGNIVSQSNASNAPRLMYTGGAYDSVTGTYLDRAREDDPESGRWLSQDPTGLAPDINPYRYAQNIPINEIDPTGLDVIIGVPKGSPPPKLPPKMFPPKIVTLPAVSGPAFYVSFHETTTFVFKTDPMNPGWRKALMKPFLPYTYELPPLDWTKGNAQVEPKKTYRWNFDSAINGITITPDLVNSISSFAGNVPGANVLLGLLKNIGNGAIIDLHVTIKITLTTANGQLGPPTTGWPLIISDL